MGLTQCGMWFFPSGRLFSRWAWVQGAALFGSIRRWGVEILEGVHTA
jgi:hypothetical protein